MTPGDFRDPLPLAPNTSIQFSPHPKCSMYGIFIPTFSSKNYSVLKENRPYTEHVGIYCLYVDMYIELKMLTLKESK